MSLLSDFIGSTIPGAQFLLGGGDSGGGGSNPNQLSLPVSAPNRPDINFNASGKVGRGIKNVSTGAAALLPYILQSVLLGGQGQASGLTQSNLDLLLKYAPQFASAENASNRVGQEGQAATDSALLGGVGKDITSKTLGLQQLADPEFFGLRSQIGEKGGALLEGQDPNKLTGAELANVERGQNRSNINSGLANSGSPTGAISSAMTFGKALDSKRNNLMNTLTNLGTIAPNLKSGAFNYAAATGASGAGAGQNLFQNSINTAQNTASTLGSNLLGQAGNIQQQRVDINANKVAPWEKVVGALPDY